MIASAILAATVGGAISILGGSPHLGYSAEKPFIMVYYPSYAGYFNNNTVSNDLMKAGHPIPEPSYVIPGITRGYPAFDNDILAFEQSVENRHLEESLSGVDALVYGFLQPQNNGTVRLSDSWADLKNSDLSPDGLCGTTTAQELKICYRDGAPPSNGSSGVDSQCWGNVCYGGFSAFLNLNNESGNLQHYISIGGWTYRGIMDGLVGNNGEVLESNVDNFLKTLGYLKSRGIQGVDLDIEFDDSALGYESSVLLRVLAEEGLVKKIKDLGLKLAITTQANPKMLHGMMHKGWIKSWFDQGLDHFSLMTYDFHGAFDGLGKKTGFNSSLFALPDSPYGDDEFSVNKAVEALYSLTPQNLAKVNIGLPAYSRAGLTNISNLNGGLFQSITDDTRIVPGDLDATYCSTSLQINSGEQCSGTFSYIYILNNMISPNGPFSTQDWEYTDSNSGKTYYIGSTLYANNWNATTSNVIYAGDSPTAIKPSDNNMTSYHNVFMSYISARVAKSYGEYVRDKGLGGMILWTINGDDHYENKSTSLIYNFEQGYEGGGEPIESPTIVWDSLGIPASTTLLDGKFTADAHLENAPEGDALQYTCRDTTTQSSKCEINSLGTFSLSEAKVGDEIIVTVGDIMNEADSVDSKPIVVEDDSSPQTEPHVLIHGEIQYYLVEGGSISPMDWFTLYDLGTINLNESPVQVNAWNSGWDLSNVITCPIPPSGELEITYTVTGSLDEISCDLDSEK